MSLAPGWDRRDKRTLRFGDADLERAFQEATLEPFRHRIRLAMVLVVPVWTVVYELHALRGQSSSVDNPA